LIKFRRTKIVQFLRHPVYVDSISPKAGSKRQNVQIRTTICDNFKTIGPRDGMLLTINY